MGIGASNYKYKEFRFMGILPITFVQVQERHYSLFRRRQKNAVLRPSRKFLCPLDVCDKAFNIQPTLSRHRKAERYSARDCAKQSEMTKSTSREVVKIHKMTIADMRNLLTTRNLSAVNTSILIGLLWIR